MSGTDFINSFFRLLFCFDICSLCFKLCINRKCSFFRFDFYQNSIEFFLFAEDIRGLFPDLFLYIRIIRGIRFFNRLHGGQGRRDERQC